MNSGPCALLATEPFFQPVHITFHLIPWAFLLSALSVEGLPSLTSPLRGHPEVCPSQATHPHQAGWQTATTRELHPFPIELWVPMTRLAIAHSNGALITAVSPWKPERRAASCSSQAVMDVAFTRRRPPEPKTVCCHTQLHFASRPLDLASEGH